MDFLRQIVSGPKKRFQEDGYNLDLTYVCPRLVAMSFPASGIETLYRNNIENVSKMIKKKHNGDYLIINLSGRKYDYSKFQDKVFDYEWEDHHSPPINTLFIICQRIHRFLEKKIDNVVIIHCLAGKGRTGTIICCYMIYSGRFQTAQDALLYYGKKRFLQEGLGVNQPCQIRYVYYFQQVFTERNVYPTLKYIKSIEILGRPRFSDDGCRPFIQVFGVNSKQMIFTTAKNYSEQPKFTEGDSFLIDIDNCQPLSGDIIVRFKNNGAISNKNMFRISCNTAFIQPKNILEFTKSELSPSEILKDERFPKNFIIRINFGDFCQCTCYTPFNKKCSSCILELDKESADWNTIYTILASYKKPELKASTLLLFGKEIDDVDEILNKEKISFVQAKQVLMKGKSLEQDKEDLGNVNEYMFEQSTHLIEDRSVIKEEFISNKQVQNNNSIDYNAEQQTNGIAQFQLTKQLNDNAGNLLFKEQEQQQYKYQEETISQPFFKPEVEEQKKPEVIETQIKETTNQINFQQQKKGSPGPTILVNSQAVTIERNEKLEEILDFVQKNGNDIQIFSKDEERPCHLKEAHSS